MDRRKFLQRLAATSAGVEMIASAAQSSAAAAIEPEQAAAVDVTSQTQICEFQLAGTSWKVYEDLSRRDGSITFVPARGDPRVMEKRTEATFTQAAIPYLGLKIEDIGASGPDLLANKLLEHGDPDPIEVRDAAMPLGGPAPIPAPGAPQGGFAAGGGGVDSWNNIVGTKECNDTMPVYAGGNTRTYHPNQYFTELSAGAPNAAGTGDRANQRERWEGLLGGWMPAVHKIFPINGQSYIEMVIFGDVEAHDKFIVQTWHRTARIDNGKITKVVYGYSYPAFPPFKQDPKPEEFYRALLVFAN